MPRRKKGKQASSSFGKNHRQAEVSPKRDDRDDDADLWYDGGGSSSSSSSSSVLFLSGDLPGFLLLASAATLAYSPIFSAGFVWDDSIITDSELVQRWDGVYDLWFRPSNLRNEIHYWPMVYTTFWLEYRLYGLEPFGYHAVNLALHVMNSYLVRRVLNKLGANDSSSWLAASIFALHPARVESVAWVIERKDVLSGLFYLLALVRHPSVGGVDEEEAASASSSSEAEGGNDKRHSAKKQWGYVRAALGYYALGMLSKSIVVSLPVILLIVPWMMRGTLTALEVRRSIPFFVVGILMAMFDMSMARKGEPVDFGFSPFRRILIAARALCFYLTQTIWPAELIGVHPRWTFEDDVPIWAGCFLFISAASLASLGVLLSTFRGRNADASKMSPCGKGEGKGAATATATTTTTTTTMPLRIPAAAFVSFGATLFPVLCVLDYGYMRFSYVADRFAYLAAIAPISAFAVGIVEGCQRLFVVPRSPSSSSSSSSSKMVPWNGTVTRAPPVLRALTSVLLAILATLTYRHASIYTTEENFYRHVVTHNPNARSMWLNLGNAYMRQERNAEAADCYATSYEQNPSQDKLHTNYGIVLSKLGRIEEAAAMLERGLESEEKTPGGLKRNLNELGNAMSKLGRYDDATAYFRRALEIDPMYAIGWNNLGNDLYRAGRPEDAVDAYRRAFGIDPNYAKARNNCAIVLGTLNRHGEEAELWRSILSVDPDNADAERRLEAALAKIV